MNKFILTIILLISCTDLFCQDSLKKKKILIVGTNVNSFGTTGNGTLSWEIGYPFQYFIDNGFDVDIITPKGGKAAIYDLFVPKDLERILQSELFTLKTKNSLSPDQINDSTYCAVFYPGGYGQFIDVIENVRICDITARIYERVGVIGTCGHGTASLINIKLNNSKYLVDGKKMTCFPWSMERTMSFSNYGTALPFNMEDVLTKRGANLLFCPKGSKQNKECAVIVDVLNRMITGTSAFEAQGVAEEMVKLLKKG